jgi:hypothetical protein
LKTESRFLFKTLSRSGEPPQYFNERFLNLFFNVFGICPEQQENNPKISTLTNYAKIAA